MWNVLLLQVDALFLDPQNVANCVSKGKSERYDCRNHIRVIQPIGDGSKLYLCGTNAHNPRDLVIYDVTSLIFDNYIFLLFNTSGNLSYLAPNEHFPGIGDGIAKCPFDPDDNATAVWVEHGNPGGLPGLYSGTVAEFTKADTVIFRTNLYNLTTGASVHPFKRTIKYDSKWLDKPHFVGSYDIGDYVVCKRDTGGKNILNKNWASYLKARLNCSIPGEFPFYFNEIHKNGLLGSAICSYSLDSIQEVFNGKFKEQATSSSAWLPVLTSKVPEPRPGLCVNDTQTLPDSVLNFIRGHPLMDSAVSHDNAKPVYYKRDVIFTCLVVDMIEVDGVKYTVYYAGSTDGYVYKLVEWYDRLGEEHSNLVDIFEATVPDPVRAIEISSKHKSLYVSSDFVLRQFDLVMCKGRFANCLRCIQDPYCGWDKERGECKPYVNGLLQDVTNATPGICDNCVKNKPLHVFWGQSVHLSCAIHMPDIESMGMGPLRWYHYSREKGKYAVIHRREKYIHTADHGLVILSVSERDAGRYDCKLGTSTLCSFNITVDTKTCSAPSEAEYRKIYSDWCHEFEKYKMAMKTWQTKQAKCQSVHPNDVTYQGGTLV
ncbi:hypothetical protein CEXT_675802 [Caerostris extrusa]|uniref:Semaphorin-2A n=1 Tax=Caerostris extrusa TaxID=172846 RepID=A0AAV4XA54_CAEEX|nr:hypothetical protein CEXT_675802 [Caerostris extrusa]